jgi:hypothetical protein
MPPPPLPPLPLPPKSRNPWKVLLVALLVCTICFVLAVSAVVYWFVSLAGRHNVRTQRQIAQQEERGFRRAFRERPGEAPGTNNLPGVGGTTNQVVQSAPGNRPSVSRPPAIREGNAPVRNAILAFKNEKAHPGDDIFRDIVVPNLEIQMSMTARARLTVNPRSYVPVDIREGDKVYKNVAIRLKGGPGSFRPLSDSAPSLTLNFDKFTEGQTFHGLKKIHLNGSVQDHSYLNEKISRELFEAAGVPVPRAGHAIVALNGRQPRVFVLLEGVNKQFMKRYFKDATGNVYDGHSGTDVNNDLPVNSGDEQTAGGSTDYSRLRALARAAAERNLETRLQKLEQTLDVDRFLSFVAMEVILCHWDGYTIGRNNFRIAHDRDHDRMVFVPHGMDQMLGNQRQPLTVPNANGLVARSVLQVPELRARYEDRVAELATNVFVVAAITDRVREVTGKVADALEDVDPQLARSFREKIGPSYAGKVRMRATTLQREINPSARPSTTKFDQLSAAPLTNWSSKIDLGDAKLTEVKEENGNVLLYIGTKTGCTASWRTTVALDPGKYRIEARIKTKGVMLDENDPRAGAGLRVSRVRTGQKNEGDHDWMPIHFDFDVQGDGGEKEIVCELRADEGEIWYELKSLKLKRL